VISTVPIEIARRLGWYWCRVPAEGELAGKLQRLARYAGAAAGCGGTVRRLRYRLGDDWLSKPGLPADQIFELHIGATDVHPGDCVA
jgi:hypothetical protein